jgi:hypothetical protein
MSGPESQTFKVRHAYSNSPNFAKSFWVREVGMDDELMERSDDSGELLDASADCIEVHRELTVRKGY